MHGKPTIAYVVSRFPVASETFILRELNGVEDAGLQLRLWALFAAPSPFLHPSAERWMPRLELPKRGEVVWAALGWLVRRPLRTASTLGLVAGSHWRRPRYLVRALAAALIATAHARSARTGGVSHVHAHFASYPAIAAWVIYRMVGCSYSVTAHAHDIFIDQSFLPRILKDASFVVAISAFNRDYLRQFGAGHRTPIHVVHCGIELSAYAYRPRFVPLTGVIRGLCVASFREYKGHAVLLDALSLAGSEGERIVVDLVGSGPLQPAIEAQARAQGLTGRVNFLGSRTEEQVAQLLDTADFFVLPSIVAADRQMEGIPVALMEAMAAGVPVIATELSGVPELVRHRQTGLLASPGDADSLARLLIGLLNDPPGAHERACRAYQLVGSEFRISETVRMMVRLFGSPVSLGVTHR
jgi:colanic acid/amylovoran biosynthesis glycosyltransferase